MTSLAFRAPREFLTCDFDEEFDGDTVPPQSTALDEL